jgi:hypothetical protein
LGTLAGTGGAWSTSYVGGVVSGVVVGGGVAGAGGNGAACCTGASDSAVSARLHPASASAPTAAVSNKLRPSRMLRVAGMHRRYPRSRGAETSRWRLVAARPRWVFDDALGARAGAVAA